MSSTTFFTDLTPDAVAHTIVLATGAGALCCGALAVATLPIGTPAKGLAIAAWIAVGGRDLWLIASGNKQCRRIRLHYDGSIEAWSRDAHCAAARLGAGSIVLPTIAWLRIEFEGGGNVGVLLRRKAAQNKDWRRLQVIWRHLGAGD